MTDPHHTNLDSIIKNNRMQKASEIDNFTEDRYRQMCENLPAGPISVLDVGCGLGRGGSVIKELRPAASLIGLDCVPERIEKLDRAIYADAVVSFTHVLPFEDRSIDAIIAGEFLEHVPPRFIEQTICEFFRVLKLKGIVSLTTPNPRYIKNRVLNLSVLTDPSHMTQHYPEVLRKRIMGVGFSSIRILGSGKVSRILGQGFPLFLYGSYILTANKW